MRSIQLNYAQTEIIEICLSRLDLIVRQVAYKNLNQISLSCLDDLRDAIKAIDDFYMDYRATN